MITIDERLRSELQRLAQALVPDDMPDASPPVRAPMLAPDGLEAGDFVEPRVGPGRHRRVVGAAAAVLLIAAGGAGLVIGTSHDRVPAAVRSSVPVAATSSELARLRWAGGVEMIVYVGPGTDQTELDAIHDALAAVPDVVDVDRLAYLDVQQSIDEAAAIFADDPDEFALLNRANIPTEFKVVPQAGRTADLHALAAQLELLPGVNAVSFADSAQSDGPQPALSSTTVTVEDSTPLGPSAADTGDASVYGTTLQSMPVWPEVRTANTGAATSEYGLQLCSSGVWTKYADLTGPGGVTTHRYQGTLCPVIALDAVSADAVGSCSSLTIPNTGALYARCMQRAPDSATAMAGQSFDGPASSADQTSITSYPTGTPDPYSPQFSDTISSVNGEAVDRVVLTSSATDDAICFTIEMDSTSANGCASRVDLSSGLLYGAFDDGDGVLTVVGIVPDEIATVDVGSQTITPRHNVWRTTVPAGTPFQISVHAQDGTNATTSPPG